MTLPACKEVRCRAFGGTDKLVFQFKTFADEVIEHRIVEVGVCDSSEQCVDYEVRRIAVGGPLFSQKAVYDSHPPDDIQELVHSCRGLRLFAAHSLKFTAFASGCFLTLITKHVHER